MILQNGLCNRAGKSMSGYEHQQQNPSDPDTLFNFFCSLQAIGENIVNELNELIELISY